MDCFLGEIRIFAGTYAPVGWMLCSGQTLPINQYQALFAILGTTYGGDGKANFKLPDLRGRVPIHAGIGPGTTMYVTGQAAGAELVTLTTNQMPLHSHALVATTAAPDSQSPAGNSFATPASSAPLLYSSKPQSSATVAILNQATVAPAGRALPISVVQPYLSLNFIIALTGLFPQRN